MMRKIILFVLLIMFVEPADSQKILNDIRKYDLEKIENQIIKKTRKRLKTDKERHLSAFIDFAVWRVDLFNSETCTAVDFLNNLKLSYKYSGFVYDDSLKIITMAIGKYLLDYANTTPDMLYIEYIKQLNPEYVFAPLFDIAPNLMYFCYKDGEIIIVYPSDDGKAIFSCPLSEFKNWQWLNATQ